MRTFLIVCAALISTACAISVGYSYESNGGASFGNGLSSSQGFGRGLSYGGPSVSGPNYASSGISFGSGVGGGQVGGLSLGSQGIGGSSYSTPSFSFGGGFGGGSVGDLGLGIQGAAAPSYSAPAAVGLSYTAPVETVKEFYTYTAPEHEFNDIGDISQFTNSLKKNLRVIFVKGPENNGLEQAALQLAKSAVNEQTAIYVLSKQADIGALANKLQSVGTHNSNKPEVHFIKYKTAADAEHAQHTIQSQYDSLQGPTSRHSGGVAPVLNFVSNPAPAPVVQHSYYAAPVGNVEISYLPPNKRA